MLTGADLELAEREATIPGFATLLDSAHVCYLRYKPGTSLLAGLEVSDTGASRFSFAKAYTKDGASKIAKLRDEAVVDNELLLVSADATADPRLPALRDVADDLEPLRYKPERRWVGRGEDTVVKVHRPGAAAWAVAAQHAFDAAGMPVPALDAKAAHAGVLTYQRIEGMPLDECGVDTGRAAATGELLARLHASVDPEALPQGPASSTVAADAVAAVAACLPQCWTVAQSAAFSALGTLRVTVPVEWTAVHGDFSADQVICTQGGPQLVDLDRVCVDDPLADLASWVAAEVTRGRAPADASPADVLGPLLTAYETAAGVPVRQDRLTALTAIALLRRAVEPFRHRVDDWPCRVRALVHAADRLASTR